MNQRLKWCKFWNQFSGKFPLFDNQVFFYTGDNYLLLILLHTMNFRQDYDQCARRHLQIGLGISDPDYYEFEGMQF